MTIYQRIKELRESLGMTQQELAEKVGFKTASAVNKIELGLRDINQGKIVAFANALGTTPGYLMGWEEEPEEKDEASDIEALKMALFSGNTEVTDEMWEEVVNFARFVEAREAQKKKPE